MTPAEVLRKAADVILERGWCRLGLEDDDGKVCVVGAINASFDGNADRLPYDRTLWPVRELAIEGFGTYLGKPIVVWNDEVFGSTSTFTAARNQQQVVDTLRSAATRIEAAARAVEEAAV